MSYGYVGNECIVLNNSVIEKVMGKTKSKNLIKMLDEVSGTIEFSEYISYCVDDVSASFSFGKVFGKNTSSYFDADVVSKLKKLHRLWHEFAQRMKENNVNVLLNYHDKDDNGSQLDDVDGWFIEIPFNSMYVMTPAAKKMQKVFGDFYNWAKFVEYCD